METSPAVDAHSVTTAMSSTVGAVSALTSSLCVAKRHQRASCVSVAVALYKCVSHALPERCTYMLRYSLYCGDVGVETAVAISARRSRFCGWTVISTVTESVASARPER